MDTTGTTSQRLTIRIGCGSLSFSKLQVRSDGSRRVVFEPYTVKSGISMAANLREAFKSSPLLAERYQHVLVMVDSKVLMVPLELYRAGEGERLYGHAFPDERGAAVLSYVMPPLNAVALFSINKDLKLVIDDHYADARLCCVMAPVWQHLYKRSHAGVRSKLFAYFHDGQLDVFSFSQNRFKFTNAFDTSLPHDALYYLLYVWKQLGLNAEEDELHLVGDVPQQGEMMDELRRYVKRVYVINPVGDFNRAPVTRIKGMAYDLMTYYVTGR